MTPDGVNGINHAIKACLRSCYDAESPLAALAAFLCDLRQSGNWNDADMELIELRALRMLKLMVRRSDSGELEALVITDRSAPEVTTSRAASAHNLAR